MPNQYDRIFRETIEAIFVPMLRRWFGINFDKVKNLPGKLELSFEREPDFLKLVENGKKGNFILHIEYQTKDDPDMVYRMQTYHAILIHKYRLPIKQKVIHLGKKRSKMRYQLEDWEMTSGFELVDVSRIDYKFFLESDLVEEMGFALLADFGDTEDEEAVEAILKRIHELEGDSKKSHLAIQRLLMLSRINKLEAAMKEGLKSMPFTIDIEQDIFYTEGREKGKDEKAKEVAVTMLLDGLYTLDQICKVSGLPLDRVLEIKNDLEG